MKTYYNPNKGAVKLATDFTEYAYNYSTTTTDDTTSFGYGQEGALIQAFAPTGNNIVQKYVKFKNPIQPTDSIDIELLDGLLWQPIVARLPQYSNDAGTVAYGVAFAYIDNYTINMVFYSAPTVGSFWSGFTTWRWRARKVSGGNLAEQPEVNPSITVTGNYSIIPNIKTVNVNASTATIDLTNMIVTDSITIRKISSYDGNALVITPPSGATFEGKASISLYGQYSFVEIERISATVFAIRDIRDRYSTATGEVSIRGKMLEQWGYVASFAVGTTAVIILPRPYPEGVAPLSGSTIPAGSFQPFIGWASNTQVNIRSLDSANAYTWQIIAPW